MNKPCPISPRFAWMAAILPIEPDHRILEIGCGHGIALGAVAGRLTSGTVTGLDRSAKMIALAAKRNAALVAAGRIRLRTASSHELADDPGSFDVIFAMDVASFRTRPERDLVAARHLLPPNGALCLSAQQPPWGRHVRTFTDDTTVLLVAYGFIVIDCYRKDMAPHPVAAVIARVAPALHPPEAADPHP